ncbi:MAG: acylphosphatase [Phycisphaerae bacterium]
MRRCILFAGRVQGVGFRATTAALARSFPVAGYVRNLPDGRVEVVVEGVESALTQFLATVRREFAGYIRDVHESPSVPASGGFAAFEIRH